MTYFEWLLRGPPGAEGATLVFDIAMGLCFFSIGVFLVVQAIKEAK